ncbi:hypothetical protein BH23GEM9_BH23GEM9_29150 [soil metagenome]
MRGTLGRLAAFGRRSLRRRRFQAYCIGTAKSGTASIAEIFRPGYRVGHEPDAELLIERILSSAAERGERADADFLRARDRRLRLELDSSQLNLYLAENLARTFPRAQFILTVREPLDWVDSFINHQLSRPASEVWRRFRDHRFLRGPNEQQEEQVLREHGLYTLEGYLSYWSWHNQRALEVIPAERLLVLRTRELGTSIPRLAEFLQIPASTLAPGKAHANRARTQLGILGQLPGEYLDAMVRRHCGVLMQRFFPEQGP